MGFEFRMPNITAPTEKEQLAQLKSYFYYFIPHLQWILNTLGTADAPQSESIVQNNTTAPNVAFDILKPFITNSYVAQSAFDTFVKQTADIKITKSLNAQGWYKVGTLSGETCAVATLTVGGLSVNDQVSPSMVDVATQDNQARTILRLPSLEDNQISKIGVVTENTNAYGVYAYYNSVNENTVSINIHIHMGAFVSADLVAASVTDSDMLSSINVKQ